MFAWRIPSPWIRRKGEKMKRYQLLAVMTALALSVAFLAMADATAADADGEQSESEDASVSISETYTLSQSGDDRTDVLISVTAHNAESVTFDWGDDRSNTISVSTAEATLSSSHVYGEKGQYTITVTATAEGAEPAKLTVQCDARPYVASVGESSYTTFNSAYAAALRAGGEQTIDLVADAESSVYYSLPAGIDLTVNLNGHTLTASKSIFYIDDRYAGISLTINGQDGGKIDAGSNIIMFNAKNSTEKGDAKISINGGTYIGDYTFTIYNADEFSISDATITASAAGIWFGNLGANKATISNTSVTTTSGEDVSIYLGTVKQAILTNVTATSECTALEIKSGDVTINGGTFIGGKYSAPVGAINHDGSGSGEGAVVLNNAYCVEAGVDGVKLTINNADIKLKEGVEGKAMVIQNDEKISGYTVQVVWPGKNLSDIAYLSTTEDLMTFNNIKLNGVKATVTYSADDVTQTETVYFATLKELMDLYEESKDSVTITGVDVTPIVDITFPAGQSRIDENTTITATGGNKIIVPSGSSIIIDGTIVANGLVDFGGNADVNGMLKIEGRDGRFVCHGILDVGGTVILGSGVNGSMDKSISAANGASITGFFSFGGNNVIKLDDLMVGNGGATIAKGSVVLSGVIDGGKIELEGDVKVADDLVLKDTEVTIKSNATVTIPAGVSVTMNGTSKIANSGDMEVSGTLVSTDSAIITNSGDLTVKGTVDVVSVSNNGRIDVVKGQLLADSSTNNGTINKYPESIVSGISEDSIHDIKVLIDYSGAKKITVNPGKYILLNMKASPGNAQVSISADWLRYNTQGFVSGYAPSKVGTYNVTINATCSVDGVAYTTQPLMLEIIVEEEPVADDSKEDKTLTTSDVAKIIIILLVAAALIYVACRVFLRI